MPNFQAGAATSNITPPLGISINGGMQDRTAAHIHDELHARCLVLDDGAGQFAFVVCDVCALPAQVIESARHQAHEECGIPTDRILVSATHTHSAPTVVSVFQSDPSEEYAEFLAMRIADAIRRAVHNLVPARIGWGSVAEPNEVFNRRWRMKPGAIPPNPFGATDQVQMNPGVANPNLVEPAGPVDPQISYLAVQALDGRALAVLANYSLHYVGDVPGDTISADYFGEFADRLTQLLRADRLDPPFVGIMTNGTSGNINNIDFRTAREAQPAYSQIRRVAAAVAKQVAGSYASIKFQDWVSIDARETVLSLERRLPTPDEVARAKFILSQAKQPVLVSLEEVYARETVLMKELPPRVEVPLQAIRLGELGIAAIPCEVFVETGLAIKRESPLRPTFVIELANDYAGYLPTPEHHALGGYETWRARSGFLETGAEPKIRAAVLDLLGQLAKG